MSGRYIDIQLNGYAGVDFNSPATTAEEMHNACLQLKEDSVETVFATVITASAGDMSACINTIVKAREEYPLVADIVKGIHIEGPFLNPRPGYRGAHPVEFIPGDRSGEANIDLLKSLLDAAGGLARIVTLAPEMDPGFKMISFLAKKGVIVSAGHCDPSLDELKAAIDSGLKMFTHLGNGCENTLARHDNIIQRVLSLSDKLYISFIADGNHIPFPALRNYIRAAGIEKSIIVTDAMAGASAPPGRYTLGHMELEIGADRIARMPGSANFAGSAVSMQQSFDKLLNGLDLSQDEVLKLCRYNALELIGEYKQNSPRP